MEVSPFEGIPSIEDPDHPDRENIVNLISAKNMLEGLNKTYGLVASDEAKNLKILLEDYRGQIDQ